MKYAETVLDKNMLQNNWNEKLFFNLVQTGVGDISQVSRI